MDYFYRKVLVSLSHTFSQDSDRHIDTILRRRASNPLAKIGLFQKLTDITLSPTPNYIVLFFFPSSTKTLVRLFCSLFRPIDNSAVSTLRRSCGIEIRRRQDVPRGNEHSFRGGKRENGKVLEERRGSIGRDLYWNQKWMLNIESEGDEKCAIEARRRQIARKRERRMKKSHGRQLICTYTQHSPGNSIQLLTLMYNVPLYFLRRVNSAIAPLLCRRSPT